MNAYDKKLIKQFIASKLWPETTTAATTLRLELDNYCQLRGICPLEGMEEFEYQTLRIEKFLNCY